MDISDAQARKGNELAGALQRQDVNVVFNVMIEIVKLDISVYIHSASSR